MVGEFGHGFWLFDEVPIGLVDLDAGVSPEGEGWVLAQWCEADDDPDADIRVNDIGTQTALWVVDPDAQPAVLGPDLPGLGPAFLPDAANVTILGDVDGEGQSDLWVSLRDVSEGEYLYGVDLYPWSDALNDPVLDITTVPPIDGLYPGSRTLADFDGDGVLDLAVGWSKPDRPTMVLVHYGPLAPTLTLDNADAVIDLGHANLVHAMDLDGDGAAELWASTEDGLWAFARPSGELGIDDAHWTWTAGPGESLWYATVGDANGDLVPDLLVTMLAPDTTELALLLGPVLPGTIDDALAASRMTLDFGWSGTLVDLGRGHASISVGSLGDAPGLYFLDPEF
ncbi:MAG: hypothetical protein ACI8PZ_002649 [Myxococcota bacterium]|jgi:hypothetical protein